MGTLRRVIDFAISPHGLVAAAVLLWGAALLPFTFTTSYALAIVVTLGLYSHHQGMM